MRLLADRTRANTECWFICYGGNRKPHGLGPRQSPPGCFPLYNKIPRNSLYQLFSLRPPHQVDPHSTGCPDPPGWLRPLGGPRPGAWAQHCGPERRLQPSSPAAQPGTHPHPLCHLPAAVRFGRDPEPLTCERENHSSTAKYCHAVHEGACLEACPHTGTPEGARATFWWLPFPPLVSSPVSSWL